MIREARIWRDRGVNGHFSFLDDLIAIELRKASGTRSALDYRKEKLSIFTFALAQAKLRRLATLLDRELHHCLRTVSDTIPRNTITAMRENYCELLPKTMRFKSAPLTERSKAGRAAKLLGISDILSSQTLRMFGERITGRRLKEDPGQQVICYETGDFSGPHNDHHPEQSYLRAGYVDIHIMLSEPTVQSQLLVYERKTGLLNEVREIGNGLAIAVYQLPFWHYTTPLMPRPNVSHAKRWLFLASYVVDRS